jgi:deoxyadenosine/deoxycytidine kinase
MIDNLFFIGGPHGSGKTTLVDKLKEQMQELLVPELDTRTPKFYTGISEEEINFFHRQALKHAERAIENYEYYQIAKRKPDKVIIGNRTYYDVLAYDYGYFNRGWITEEEREILEESSKFMVIPDLTEPFTIILNPGFDVCKKHLKERWKTKPKKFMEMDMDYLNAICEAYCKFQCYPNVYYISHEIDFNGSDAAGVIDWMEKIRGGVLV